MRDPIEPMRGSSYRTRTPLPRMSAESASTSAVPKAMWCTPSPFLASHLPDRGVLPGRLQQLEVGGPAVRRLVDLEHGLADALLLVDLGVEHLEAVGGAVELDGLVEVETGDPDVVDSRQHAASAARSEAGYATCARSHRSAGDAARTAQYIRVNPRSLLIAKGPRLMSGTTGTTSVIVAGARTPMGRLLGSLKSFSGADLGGVAIKAALDRAGHRRRPGAVRDHGPGAPGRGRADPGAPGGRQGRHPDERPRAHHQQGVSLRPRRHRARRPADPRRRVRRRRRGRPGVHDQRPAPAAEVPRGLQVRRRRDARRDGVRRPDRRLREHRRWASRPRSTTPASASSAPAQDEIAAQSHQRAAAAQKNGLFEAEITPVEIPQRKGDPVLFSKDEGIRAETTAESLGKLRPAFAKDGTITAGTSSQISDGAAAVVVMSKAKAAGAGPGVDRRDRRPRQRGGPRQLAPVAARRTPSGTP